jgi:hypothetical protein
MPFRERLATTSITAACAAAILVLAASHAAAQPINCNWYADTALKQQQQNEQRKCGFSGPEWSSNKQAHVTWCATQAPDRWKREAQKREQMLDACKR